jgi:hypothetical protein
MKYGNLLNKEGDFQMQTVISQQPNAVNGTTAATCLPAYPPIDQETRSHVETACAAFHLLRKPQTLRVYACLENGPIRPVRINGRLAWAVSDIKRLLNGGQ